jgi:hypothetical protein
VIQSSTKSTHRGAFKSSNPNRERSSSNHVAPKNLPLVFTETIPNSRFGIQGKENNQNENNIKVQNDAYINIYILFICFPFHLKAIIEYAGQFKKKKKKKVSSLVL